MRLDLCRVPCGGGTPAAAAGFIHGLRVEAGRGPALITPEGGRIAGRLFPQRPTSGKARPWERSPATSVRRGGDSRGRRPVQETGAWVIPWDDRLHARDALAGRGRVGGSP